MPNFSSVLILSVTKITSSPRVIRQIHSLSEWKKKVVVAGFFNKTTDVGQFKNCTLIKFSKTQTMNFWQKIGYLFFSPLFSFQERIIEVFYGRTHLYKQAFDRLKASPVHTIICHDYYTAPIGYILSKIFQCDYLIDVHEHALTQHQPASGVWKRLVWFFQRRYVHKLQKKYFPQARALTTVSDGIADSLQQDYHLPTRPTVIHSVPFYQTCPFRPLKENDPIRLLYHGDFAPDRGLEECIQAMALCDERFSLTLRGSGNPAYCKSLHDLAQQSSASSRIHFEPPVPFQDIVAAASLFDMGLFIPPDVSLQRKYTLPNKFFEYIMAGMALVVTDLPEMAHIVRAYQLGVLVPSAQPKDIAHSLNALTWEAINEYKQQSLKAAKALCWEEESKKLKAFFS